MHYLADGRLVVEWPDETTTKRFARALATNLSAGDYVLLDGPVGAGKTFLTSSVVRALGLTEDVPVQSPTFALVHEYPELSPCFVHADLYRLSAVDELDYTDLPEHIRSGQDIVFIEWGATFAQTLGRPTLLIEIVPDADREDSRTATLSGSGELLHRIASAFDDRPPS